MGESSSRLTAGLQTVFEDGAYLLQGVEAVVDSHVVFWEEEAVGLYLEEGEPIALRAKEFRAPHIKAPVPAVPVAIVILGRGAVGAVAGCMTGVLHLIGQGTLDGTAWSRDYEQRQENLRSVWPACRYGAVVGAGVAAGLGKWWARITGGRTPPG
jgi:hypothetical protein